MFLLRFALNALALLVVARILPGIYLSGLASALVAVLVLGLVNTLVRPVLFLLTLPLTILTLGLFAFVVNALAFWLASALTPGFSVNGWWAALGGAALYSLLTAIINWTVGSADRQVASRDGQ